MSKEVANNTNGANLYMTGTQYSRLFALAYLDDCFRSDTSTFEDQPERYKQAVAKNLKMIQDYTPQQKEALITSLLGGQQERDAFINDIPEGEKYLTTFYNQLAFLIPEQSFHDALEENPLWAATNSIAYVWAIHHYDYIDVKHKKLKNNIFAPGDGSIKASDMTKTLMRNMLFVRVMMVDDIPSVIEGYSFNVITDIAKAPGTAITLPSNATTC